MLHRRDQFVASVHLLVPVICAHIVTPGVEELQPAVRADLRRSAPNASPSHIWLFTHHAMMALYLPGEYRSKEKDLPMIRDRSLPLSSNILQEPALAPPDVRQKRTTCANRLAERYASPDFPAAVLALGPFPFSKRGLWWYGCSRASRYF